MHEANLEIPEQKLREYISILSDVLSDSKHIGGQPQAQLAIQKLNELPSMEITVENKDKIRNAIHAAKDHALSEIIEERETSLQFIKEETQKGVQKLKEETQTDDTKINAIRPCEPEEDTTFDKDVERPGNGKTALCRKITCSWCKVHTANTQNCVDNKTMDLLKTYDLLFNIPSVEIHPKSESLEELIKNTILPPELHNTFNEVIKTKKCLIILDGLEEWFVTEEGKKVAFFDSLPKHMLFR